jgi:ATP synthase protein I
MGAEDGKSHEGEATRADGSRTPPEAGTASGEVAGAKRSGGAVRYASAGLEFAAAIGIGLFAGQWLDKRFGTAPWLLMLGVFVGAAAGFLSLLRTLSTPNRRATSQRNLRS